MKNLIKCFQISCVFFLMGVGMVHGVDADGQLSPTKKSNHNNDNEGQLLNLSESTGSAQSTGSIEPGQHLPSNNNNKIAEKSYKPLQSNQDIIEFLENKGNQLIVLHYTANTTNTTNINHYTGGESKILSPENTDLIKKIQEKINSFEEELRLNKEKTDAALALTLSVPGIIDTFNSSTRKTGDLKVDLSKFVSKHNFSYRS